MLASPQRQSLGQFPPRPPLGETQASGQCCRVLLLLIMSSSVTLDDKYYPGLLGQRDLLGLLAVSCAMKG